MRRAACRTGLFSQFTSRSRGIFVASSSWRKPVSPTLRFNSPLRVVAQPEVGFGDRGDRKLLNEAPAASQRGPLTIFLDNGGSITVPSESDSHGLASGRSVTSWEETGSGEDGVEEQEGETTSASSSQQHQQTDLLEERDGSDSGSTSGDTSASISDEQARTAAAAAEEAFAAAMLSSLSKEGSSSSAADAAASARGAGQDQLLPDRESSRNGSSSSGHEIPTDFVKQEAESSGLLFTSVPSMHLPASSSGSEAGPSSPSAAVWQAPVGGRPSPPPAEEQLIPGIPQPILVISIVSATLTMASCVFQTLLPIYMVTELKMTMRSMGMFEGLMEAFSYIVRMFSGVVSDMMKSRKGAITVGFAMGAMAKFGMSGATEVGSLFASKVIDRLANGVQAAPRDALISDLAPEKTRSSCFGFAQSLRKWGSAVGAIMAYFLMKASGNNYQFIFTMAASVSLASCLAFVLLVPSHVRPEHQKEEDRRALLKQQQAQQQEELLQQQIASGSQASSSSREESERQQQQHQQQQQQQRQGFDFKKFVHDVGSMGTNFYRMLVVIALYCSSHINESMLEARAMEVGFGKAESTLVIAALALTIFVAAWPLGLLDDKYGPRVTFAVGLGAHIAADLVLMASGTHPWAVFFSLAFMGVHIGVMNGPLLSIVVGQAPAHLRGTAFGIYYTVMAVIAMSANCVFGSIWHSNGATLAFAASAAVATGTLVALPWLLPENSREVRKQELFPAAA